MSAGGWPGHLWAHGCRKRCSSPLVKNVQMLVKNVFMDCFVCKCLLSDTPQGFTGQVANVRSRAWEFPSTQAVLPLFVTPQRTSGSIAREPYLTLSSVRLPHRRIVPRSTFEEAEGLQTWVVWGHTQLHMQIGLYI